MNLPVGYFRFHKNKFLNYQLNRWYSLGFTRKEDLELIGSKIKSFEDYKREFLLAAELALRENRNTNASFYFRAAEFLTNPADPEKLILYKKFRDLFDAEFEGKSFVRHNIPYQSGNLSTLYFKARGIKKNQTILALGGFDSFIEEFYCIWDFFAENGYDVIAFDGPGQGATLRTFNLHFDHDYEKPVKAILDYFEQDDVTILGVSMGGYWAIRAAAYEPRIKNIIAMPPVYDWLELAGSFNKMILRWLLKFPRLMNFMIRLKMNIGTLKHTVQQALYITGKSKPIHAVDWMLGMNKVHLGSEKITQNVLLLGGENDAFQPPKLMYKQQAALINAKSVKTIVLQKEDHADQHCQMGNLQLALDTMLDWLNQLSISAK